MSKIRRWIDRLLGRNQNNYQQPSSGGLATDGGTGNVWAVLEIDENWEDWTIGEIDAWNRKFVVDNSSRSFAMVDGIGGFYRFQGTATDGGTGNVWAVGEIDFVSEGPRGFGTFGVQGGIPEVIGDLYDTPVSTDAPRRGRAYAG